MICQYLYDWHLMETTGCVCSNSSADCLSFGYFVSGGARWHPVSAHLPCEGATGGVGGSHQPGGIRGSLGHWTDVAVVVTGYLAEVVINGTRVGSAEPYYPARGHGGVMVRNTRDNGVFFRELTLHALSAPKGKPSTSEKSSVTVSAGKIVTRCEMYVRQW